MTDGFGTWHQCPGCLGWWDVVPESHPEACMVPDCPVQAMLGFVWVRDPKRPGVWVADLLLGSIHVRRAS